MYTHKVFNWQLAETKLHVAVHGNIGQEKLDKKAETVRMLKINKQEKNCRNARNQYE